MTAVAHWDEVRKLRREVCSIAATWSDMDEALGTVWARFCHVAVDSERRTTPLELGSSDALYVLEGSGWLRLGKTDVEISAGDLASRFSEKPVALAGPGGLELIALGASVFDEFGPVARTGVVRIGPTLASDERAPKDDAHLRERTAPTAPRVVQTRKLVAVGSDDDSAAMSALDLSEVIDDDHIRVELVEIEAGRAARLGRESVPFETVFVVTSGGGTMIFAETVYPIGRGHFFVRPQETALALRAGEEGLTYLSYAVAPGGLERSRDAEPARAQARFASLRRL